MDMSAHFSHWKLMPSKCLEVCSCSMGWGAGKGKAQQGQVCHTKIAGKDGKKVSVAATQVYVNDSQIQWDKMGIQNLQLSTTYFMRIKLLLHTSSPTHFFPLATYLGWPRRRIWTFYWDGIGILPSSDKIGYNSPFFKHVLYLCILYLFMYIYIYIYINIYPKIANWSTDDNPLKLGDGGVARSGAPSWWARPCSSWVSVDVVMVLYAKYAFLRCGGNHMFKTIYQTVLIVTYCFHVSSSSISSLTQHYFKKYVENNPYRGSLFFFVVNFGSCKA